MRLFCVFALTTALLLGGCGGDDGGRNVHVKGTVTFDGKPVPSGRIGFEPTGDGAPGFATIKDGEFDTSLEGNKGTVGGPHKVMITGQEALPAGADPNDETIEVKFLFQDYSTEVDLGSDSSEQKFDVPKDAAKPKKKKINPNDV